MTRKDYVSIAAVFKRQLMRAQREQQAVARVVIAECARDMSGILSTDNPRFDVERFLAACGLEN